MLKTIGQVVDWESDEEKEQGSLKPSLNVRTEARYKAKGKIVVDLREQEEKEENFDMEVGPFGGNKDFIFYVL